MSITINELNLLNKINNKKLNLKLLAEEENMSTRNLRYKIENLNFYILKYLNKSIQIENGQIYIQLSDEEGINLLKKISQESLKLTKDERQEVIISLYLFKDKITLSKMEETFLVSRTTLNKDIKEINKKLLCKDIRLQLKGKNIVLTGNEKKLRQYKAEQLLNYVDIENDIDITTHIIPSINLISKNIQEYVYPLPIEEVKVCLDKIQKLLNVTFEKGFYIIIYLYLLVTIERVNKGYIITKKNNKEFLRGLPQYPVLRKALKEILPKEYEYEYLHLTEYFISGYSSKKFLQSEYEIATFTRNILNQLEQVVSINEKEKFSLEENIVEYLNPAIYRIKNNFTIEKIDFKLVNLELYKEVEKVCRLNNFLLSEELRDEEVYFITSLIEEIIYPKEKEYIDLNQLLSIIEKNTREANLESIKEELLNCYKHLIR